MLHTPAGADADVDLTPTLLARSLGPALGAIVGDIHRDAGLPLHLGVGVHGWTETPSGVELTLDDGETLTADAAVVGTYPRTDLRRGSGLDLTDGVLCTPTCHAQTVDGKAVESVCGRDDVTRWPNVRFHTTPHRGGSNTGSTPSKWVKPPPHRSSPGPRPDGRSPRSQGSGPTSTASASNPSECPHSEPT